jgi:hypothetical protein
VTASSSTLVANAAVYKEQLIRVFKEEAIRINVLYLKHRDWSREEYAKCSFISY